MPESRHASRYAHVARLLGCELTADDGVAADQLARAESRLGVKLPASLRDYYALMGAETTLNQSHNRLLSPADLELVQGHIAFLDENQSVVLWCVPATASASEDTAVFQCANTEPLEFHPEHASCSEFLSVMLVWQACMGAFEHHVSAPSRDDLRKALADWHHVGAIHELEAYVHEGVALCVLPWDDGPRVFMGSRNERAIETAVSRLNLVVA